MKNTVAHPNKNPLKSMTYRLPATYAVIALVVVLALGLVLYMTLRWYYTAQERTYLEDNAVPIAQMLTQILPSDDPEFLQTQVHFFSFLARTRVEIFDENDNLLASGNTFDQDPFFARNGSSRGFYVSSDTVQGDAGFDYLLISPTNNNNIVVQSGLNEIQLLAGNSLPESIVFEETLFDSSSCSRSFLPTGCLVVDLFVAFVLDFFIASPYIGDAAISVSDLPVAAMPTIDIIPANSPIKRVRDSYRESSAVVHSSPVYSNNGDLLATIRLSEGPIYGGHIITGVMYGWLIASSVSVCLAIVLGWIASRDVVVPLRNLSKATQQMAVGDLSARVLINRDDEFGVLGNSFNDMAHRIEETVNTLRHFLSDAAHEINTPITALRTNLELMPPTENTETIERALAQVKRLENLTKNLLHLSKLESDVETAIVMTMSANRLMQTVAQFHASQAEQAGLSLSLTLSASDLYIRANEAQMQQALGNLLHNAIKFTEAEGNIRISVQGMEDEVHFIIEDTGIGISETDLPYLFNRFHRGRNAARYDGNGLGLAIVEAIVTYYDGTVMAENTEQGARFTVTFAEAKKS